MTRPHISHVARDGRQRTLAVIDGELKTLPSRQNSLERATRIELAFSTWEAACPHFSRKENTLIRTDFLRTEFELLERSP
jgi:hypothetical protein